MINNKILQKKVYELLRSNSFQAEAGSVDRRELIHKANLLGGPKMKLLHWHALKELGRIPRYNESHAVDAITGIDLFGAPNVEIIMVSHRWLRPSKNQTMGHPDNQENRKATAINEFSNWRRQWVFNKHGFLPEIYYWIDFACIDQNATEDAVPLLPIWIASCERLLRITTDDYNTRAWCRIEPLLSYMYSYADHHLLIDINYKSKWPDTGIEINLPILNPSKAKVTNSNDVLLISSLTSLALEINPARQHHENIEFNKTTIKCYQL